MVNRRETIAGAKVEASSFFVNVCDINFPKSPAWICFATASSSIPLVYGVNWDLETCPDGSSSDNGNTCANNL